MARDLILVLEGPGLESKGTKDHLKRFKQKLNLILGRISNGEEDLGQRISTVEENE